MPALITHDTFGTEVYAKLFDWVGGSRDEAEAFLLGNQGPDPLFYSVGDPRLLSVHKLGSIMHHKKPAEILVAFKQAVTLLPAEDRPIGRAYALGFLCHYELDSTAHPFIYAQQYAFCDAGEPGLTREDGSDVHAAIETELDELVLTVKRHATVAEFNPAKCVLRASDHTLDVISQMYVHMAQQVYAMEIPAYTFKSSVKLFRAVQGGVFYSPGGKKREIISRLERLVRPHSFLGAMSHRNRELTSSIFDNDEHALWKSPFTGEESTASFWDLYEAAAAKATVDMLAFDAPSFNLEVARSITCDLDFSGDPVVARITHVE